MGAEQRRALREPELLRPGSGEIKCPLPGCPRLHRCIAVLPAAHMMVHKDRFALF